MKILLTSFYDLGKQPKIIAEIVDKYKAENIQFDIRSTYFPGDPYRSSADGYGECARTIRGFYRGLLASYLKVFPAISLQFFTIEVLNDFLNID